MARPSQLLDMCERDGPQAVTRHGIGAAMLVPAEEWPRINRRSRRTLKELLLADDACCNINPLRHTRARCRNVACVLMFLRDASAVFDLRCVHTHGTVLARIKA